MMPESNMNPIYRPPLHQISAKKNQKQIHDFISSYPGISSSFYSKHSQQNPFPHMIPKKRKPNPPPTPPKPLPPSEREINVVNSSLKRGQQMFWFKWDTFEAHKFSFDESQWRVQEARPTQKFLYFSTTVHLDDNAGWFLLGGCDFEDNYSKRVVHFENYATFKDKAPMISKRAFFTSCFWNIDNSIYVFGGNDSEDDLKLWERYSITENVWRQISSLTYKRNGASWCFIPDSNWLFVFGGNNREMGSLDSIEKYEIEFDKWKVISVKISNPLHDLTWFYLGSGKVMLLGGNNEDKPSQGVEVVDLGNEIENIQLEIGGKWYFDPMIDQNGVLHLFFGYGDSELLHEELNVKKYLGPPLIIKEKIINKLESIEKPLNKAELQNEDSSKRNLGEWNSLANINPMNNKLDFHMYNQRKELSSPLYSSEAHISPNQCREKKFLNLKSNMDLYQPSLNMGSSMKYDNFFYSRNTPKKKINLLHQNLSHPYSKTELEMSKKLFSGSNSIFDSSRQEDPFLHRSGKHEFNWS
jgi:hypothetical protein